MSQVSKCCGAKVLIQGANSTACGICLQPCDLIEAPVSKSEKKRIDALTKPVCSNCNDNKHVWADNGEDLIDCPDCQPKPSEGYSSIHEVREQEATPKPTEAGEFVKEMREKYRYCEDIGYACSIIESQERQIETLKKLEVYPAAARSIALWLDDYCDKNLSYDQMIADAASKAAKWIKKLTEENEHLRQSVKE